MVTKGESTRQTILDKALSVASVEGLGGLSIGHLAEAVGLSKSGLFAHFKSKEQLQLETVRHGVERFVATVLAPALKAARGEPRLRALFEAWLRWEHALPGGCVLEAAIVEFDDQDGPVRDYLVETQRDLAESMAQVARSGIAAGAFRADLDVERFAFEVLGLMLAYRRHMRLFRDEQAERLVRDAFEDLLARIRA